MYAGVLLISLVLVCGGQTGPPPQQIPEGKVEFVCLEKAKKRFKKEAVRIGGKIKAPKKLVDAYPDYPELPPDTRVSGIWVGEVLVAPDGTIAEVWAVREPKVEPPFPDFHDALPRAIKQWKYAPVIVDGESVPFCMVVTATIGLW